jgi:hypothetical protein
MVQVALRAAAASPVPAAPSLKPYLEKLIAGESLTKAEAKAVCGAILAGAEPLQVPRALGLGGLGAHKLPRS